MPRCRPFSAYVRTTFPSDLPGILKGKRRTEGLPRRRRKDHEPEGTFRHEPMCPAPDLPPPRSQALAHPQSEQTAFFRIHVTE